MDREALAQRNRALAAAIHRRTLKRRLRDGMLHAFARLPAPIQKTESERLLIIKPDHLGDALLATPAIQAIKRKRPDTSIDVLCGPWSADILAPYREIDNVRALPFPGFQRSSAGQTNAWRLLLSSARQLRKIGYRRAFIMRPDHWWGALLAFLAGIPDRHGYATPGVAPFLTTACQLQHEHALEQNLRLAESWIGAIEREGIRLEYPLAAADREDIAGRMLDWGIKAGGSYVCIHPGSGASSKLWTEENCAQVADALAADFGAAVILTGGPAEAPLLEEIRARSSSDALRIAGATTVGQLGALYAGARAVLGPDSGALHLAAAVGCPTVALFGPADPLEFAPWGDPRQHAVITSDIACRPCRILDWRQDDAANHPCVRDISAGQVLAAARNVIQFAEASV